MTTVSNFDIRICLEISGYVTNENSARRVRHFVLDWDQIDPEGVKYIRSGQPVRILIDGRPDIFRARRH